MAKLDWQKADDYAYTDNLDHKGWAWEFIRRSTAYRTGYAEIFALIEQKHQGDWKKQPRIYIPEKCADESDNAWLLRLNKDGIAGRQLFSSQQAARQWSLWDMYDPEKIYDPEEIHFDLQNPFPAFYGLSGDVSDENGEPSAAQTIKNGILNQVRPFDELGYSLDFKADEGIIFIAVDARRPISAQLDKAEIFLKKYQSILDRAEAPGIARMDKWTLYLRMLDAVHAETGLSKAAMLREIQPDGSSGSLNYAKEDPKRVSDKAGEILKSAMTMADEGYKKLLYEIEFKR